MTLEFIEPVDYDKQKVLGVWAVYDHPKDFPDVFIARLWLVTGDGSTATTMRLESPTVEPIREKLAHEGRVKMDRSKFDDPCIVEIWL